MRKILGTAAVAALALTGIVGVAPAQAADGSCAGTRLDLITHRSNATGEVIAKTGIYSSGGQICAISIKQGSYYGLASRMELWIYKAGTDPKVDRGSFQYQAGPVRKTGCVNVELDMWAVGNPNQNVVQDYIYKQYCA